MDFSLFAEQFLNGFQLGIILFLMAAGLTLVFGIMDMVNLAHGSLYMIGAFFGATFALWTGSFIVGILLMIPVMLVMGILIELVVLRTMYERDHMDQVLATFGLILFFNELVRLIWGVDAQPLTLPEWLSGNVEILPDAAYPVYRLVVIGVGIAVAGALF